MKTRITINKNKNGYNGEVYITGTTPTRLTKTKSDDTNFSCASHVRRAANAFGKRHNLNIVIVDNTSSDVRDCPVNQK